MFVESTDFVLLWQTFLGSSTFLASIQLQVDFVISESWIFEWFEIILIAKMCRNSKFDVDFVDFNRKIDNLTEKVNISYISDILLYIFLKDIWLCVVFSIEWTIIIMQS